MGRISAASAAVAVAGAMCTVLGTAVTGPAGAAPAFAQTPADGARTTSVASTPTAAATRPPATCPTRVRRTFAPTSVSMPGVVRRAPIVTPPRVDGVPGAPPLTAAGKRQVAWDTSWPIRPGARHGNVLMNAHVWPDGSALGNRMLARLHVGDRIVVRGVTKTLCYRVVKQVQVSPREALRRYYRTDGKPRLAIVVCSGRRLGPGVWEKRTIWYAAPRD